MNVLQRKTLKQLEWLSPAQRDEIRALLQGRKCADDYKSVQDWVKQCYNRPPSIDRLMCALNEICETHGVEALWGEGDKAQYEYLNTGDTYVPTIMYDRKRHRVFVASVGDLAE